MKKVYKRPTAEIVVLNIGEPVAFGEGANASNNGIFTEAKEQQSFEEEEEKLPDYLGTMKFSNLWDDEDDD